MDLSQYGYQPNGIHSNYTNPEFQSLMNLAREDSEAIAKSLVTGEGVVTPGTTGGASLRVQFLHDTLENVSFSQDDAKLMKLIPKQKAWSNTIEYSLAETPGSGGDGFVDETGSDGAFNISYSDDNFTRQMELVKYMAEGRLISLASTEVRNIEQVPTIERDMIIRTILGKANLAGYYGNALQNNSSWNGIEAQVLAWVNANPYDTDILFDAGGQPIDKYMLEDIAIVNREKYGKGNILLASVPTKGDINKLLFPQVRSDEAATGSFGNNRDEFLGPNGKITIHDDPMLRPNRPLVVDGPGASGYPRLTTASGIYAGPTVNAPTFSGNPFVNASGSNGVQAVTPGAGVFCQNGSVNTDTGPFGTMPALPSGGSNNSNRLAGGTYYYGVSVVYRGAESPVYLMGAATQSSPTVTGSPVGVAVTSGQCIQIDIDCTTPSVTGLGSTYGRSNTSFRIYRAGGPGQSAPTSISQYQLLDTIGTPISGNARYVDNGYKIPGTDTAFLITTEKDGKRGWEMMQLLPLMRRLGLPNLAFAEPLVFIWMATVILWRRRQNMVIRNVGRAQ